MQERSKVQQNWKNSLGGEANVCAAAFWYAGCRPALYAESGANELGAFLRALFLVHVRVDEE